MENEILNGGQSQQPVETTTSTQSEIFNETESVKAVVPEKTHKVKDAAAKVAGYYSRELALIVACFLAFIIFSFGAIGLTAYKMGLDTPFTNFLLSAYSFPAVVVDGNFVKYSNFAFERKAVQQLNESTQAGLTEASMTQQVIDKLIDNALLENLAARFDIRVTDEDIQTQLDLLSTNLGGEAKVVEEVKKSFNWDMDDFKAHILYYNVLAAKLEKEIPLTKLASSDAEKKAVEVLAKYNNKEKTFEELAKEFSTDTTSAQNGGELGFFARGQMVPEFENAAFALEPGQVSQPIKTQYGVHIILVEEKKAADEKAGTTEQVKAKHILLASKQFSEFFDEYKATAKAMKFVALD